LDAVEVLRDGIVAERDQTTCSESNIAALRELGESLAWRSKVRETDWYPSCKLADERGEGLALERRNRNTSQEERAEPTTTAARSSDQEDERRNSKKKAGSFTPSTPTDEALLALLVYLEEERHKVGPKGVSKHAAARLSLLPLLLWNSKLRCAVEFLSVAENASGEYEGRDESFTRWRMLAFSCLAAKLPGRAVRASKSLLNRNFHTKGSQEEGEVEGEDRLTLDGLAIGADGSHKTMADQLFRSSPVSEKVHLLLLACRAKIDEHRSNMRNKMFNGGVDVAVATGWAEKAMNLCAGNPDLSHLNESCVTAYAGCILEAVLRGHQGNPACSPPREVYERALEEAETQLVKIFSFGNHGSNNTNGISSSSRSLNPIAGYLLSLVYVLRGKKKEAIGMLTGLQNTNSCVHVFTNTLLAVLYATEKRTSKGFNLLEKMIVDLEMMEGLGGSLEKRFFLHRVQLRFAIFKRGATAIFQRGRHGDHDDLIGTLTQQGKQRLASLLSAELSIHFAYAQKFDKARALSEKAIALDPSCPLAHHSAGVVQEGISEYGLALGKYEEAMAMCPHYGPSALASAMIWQYQMDDYIWHARDLCEDALRWNHQDYEALLALGQMKEQLGDSEASKAMNEIGLAKIGQMPCIPYHEFPVIIWEDDMSLDCYSF
jgi:tetratricopeptide (TPR) repeat protein